MFNRSKPLLLACASTLALATQADAAFKPEHKGGTLMLTASAAAGTIDPMVNYELKFWQLFAFTYDGLVSFKKVEGADSNVVVPDLAEALPTVSDGGKTYTFKLRTGVKFSNGKDLTTKDVVASFERLFKVKNPNAGSWFNGIIGSDACLKATDTTCSLSQGVVADEAAHTVTVHLTDPDAEFLYKLSTPFGTILPADTQPGDLGTSPAPTTGPYMFSAYDPNKELRMVRNPSYKLYSEDAQPEGYPDEIVYAFGLQDEAAVTAIINGQQDWMFDELPLDRLGELGTKYKAQVKVHPLLAYFYAAMNTRLAPFDNMKARLAVNFALDRNALVKLWGGQNLASTICQNLPAGMPGYEPYCPFTKNPGAKWTAPDLEKAKQLVKDSGTAGQKVTVISEDTGTKKNVGEYVTNVLRDIGYDAQLKAISNNLEFTYIQNTSNKVQISITDWYQDYPAPSDFLNVLFSCANFHEGSDSSINIAGFCDQKIEDDMKAALALSVTDPGKAKASWAAIDKAITDAAPVAPLFQPKRADLISQRVQNYVWSDQIHMLFSQAWVK